MVSSPHAQSVIDLFKHGLITTSADGVGGVGTGESGASLVMNEDSAYLILWPCIDIVMALFGPLLELRRHFEAFIAASALSFD